MKKILIIIVTYNSEKHIQWCLDGLKTSRNVIDVIIVDSGSKNISYLDTLTYSDNLTVTINKSENIGFVAANNTASDIFDGYEYVLYLNPDARIEGDNLDKLLIMADSHSFSHYGAFTVPLIRYDINRKESLNVYDSLGISCNVMGRWHDIMANEKVFTLSGTNEIEAICGAFFLARASVLLSARDSQGKVGFERKFYMYKEDIELSQRIIKSGYRLVINNNIYAYHCRGWQGDRNKIPFWARYQSARNDVFVARKYKWRALPFSIVKYIWVKFIERK